MRVWVLLIVGAVSPYLFTSTLPTAVALAFLVLTVMCFFQAGEGLRPWCIVPAVFLLTTLSINQRLSERLPFTANRTSLEVSGVVGSLPESGMDGVRFVFIPDGPASKLIPRVHVSWYKTRAGREPTIIPTIRAGERWKLQLQLRSPRGRVNFHGVDTERWYFTRGIAALAYVKDGDNIRLAKASGLALQHWRERVLDKLTAKAEGVPAFRVITALAIADRRAMRAHDREILSATGTGHLLAISGLHIGLAALMGFYFGKLALVFLLTGMKQKLAIVLPWMMAWLLAFLYAGLSGFGVSTQRALIMLTVATVVMLSRRSIHPFQAWLIAMSLVLLTDPFAPLRAGFWFSFAAVGVLMVLFIPRHGVMPAWRKVLLAQFGISLVMAPLGMYWFQQTSLPGLLANLVAIPFVSLLVVPPILVAMLLMWFPGPLAGWLLTMAGYAADCLLQYLDFVSALQPGGFNVTRAPGLVATILAMLGAVIFMLPRGSPGRIKGLLLMLPLFLPANDLPGNNETRIDFLDVGQGLAVLLATSNHLVLYDTGPGNGLTGETGIDMVRGTIAPMIEATGMQPGQVIISHADLDHAGGLGRMLSMYPDAQYLASLPVNRKGIEPCTAPRNWTTGGLGFSVLHPSAGLPYIGNDSSCVISVQGQGLSLLLTGDISHIVEQRLVDESLERHAIMSAPHHGSSTSSSQALIDRVRPEWVLVSAAAGNRFGFPRTDVLERYAKMHVPVLNTAQCGGIRISKDGLGGTKVQSARLSRDAIWRWPAFDNCP